MDKMIAYCGICCSDCPAFIATVRNDNNERKKIAEQWSKEYKSEIKPEDINCDGCVSATNRHIGHWDECEIRKCGQEKSLKNCAHCDDFDCKKLNKFLEMVPEAKTNLEDIRKNL